jgi:putative ABC transport system permease protein
VISPARLAWLQLRHQKVRLAVAIAGVAFAVILMSMQLGFMDALFSSAVNLHGRLRGDIVLIDPRYNVVVLPTRFPMRRLQQTRAFAEVESIAPVHVGIARWKNPADATVHEMFVMGVDPARPPFAEPGFVPLDRIRYPDVAVFDEQSRPEFGPVPAVLHAGEQVVTEVNGREIEVGGLFRFGTSFGIDATLVTSDLNYRRIFPNYPAGAASIGLVTLRPGADPMAVRDAIDAALDADVRVLTMQQYIDAELDYWATKTPIGFVFTFGVIMGVVVGMIIVYQILFTDVTDHLPEYATLKAMGRPNRFLSRVVIAEATLLACLGFVPGLLVSWWLYGITQSATQLPMILYPGRAATVLLLSMIMCWGSGLIAMRKLRTADPADVF